jgi:hypothetical protein
VLCSIRKRKKERKKNVEEEDRKQLGSTVGGHAVNALKNRNNRQEKRRKKVSLHERNPYPIPRKYPVAQPRKPSSRL